MRTFRRGWVVWVALIGVVIALTLTYQLQQPTVSPMSLTDLRQAIDAGKVAEIAVSGDESRATVIMSDGTRRIVLKEQSAEPFYSQLSLTTGDLAKVKYRVAKASGFGDLVPLLGTILPFVLMLGFLVFMVRQAQMGNNQALSFGRSRARLMTGDTPTVTFDDVAGVEEAKRELAEVVEFLREPDKFLALGAQIPKGVLMVGPPGCGKTLMGKAVAGEAGGPFFSISGSEFVEMFVGVGASRVRDLFDQAKKHSPCIVFIDEIDAVGRQRGTGLGGSHDEREQTLNQILVEMDGFDTDTNVIVIAATNRPDILDPALLRPGRFDRRVVIDRPDMNGRRAILGIHTQGKPLASDVDLEVIAKQTPGFSGADLENLVNEAAILAARRNGRAIHMSDMQEAIEKLIAGPERRSRLISEEERRIIAYHEAGHALVMNALPHCDPVHKVTIVSRGLALGYTMNLPTEDRTLYQQSKFEDDLAGLMGGRVAEELIFEDVTTGASNDLDRATTIARDMVTRYGMSELLGPVQFGEREELVFLGREIGEHANYSDDVAQTIDDEVRRIIMKGHDRARAVLAASIDRLDAVAKRLIEVETIDRAEFEAILAQFEPTDAAPAAAAAPA
jgi:cell division protease FtsH